MKDTCTTTLEVCWLQCTWSTSSTHNSVTDCVLGGLTFWVQFLKLVSYPLGYCIWISRTLRLSKEISFWLARKVHPMEDDEKQWLCNQGNGALDLRNFWKTAKTELNFTVIFHKLISHRWNTIKTIHGLLTCNNNQKKDRMNKGKHIFYNCHFPNEWIKNWMLEHKTCQKRNKGRVAR